MSLVLRPYQEDAVAAVQAAWATHRSVLLSLPTGGGKTEVSVALAGASASNTSRVLIVVERKVLAGQWVERFVRHGFPHVGILQGENTIRTWAPILIATAQTLRARGIPENVGMVVVDESHILHQTHDRVIEATGTAKVLGLSATPLRTGLGLRFEKLVVGATIRELTEWGHLVPARCYAPSHEQVASAVASVGIRAGDFAATELSIAMRAKALIGDVVSSWRKRADGRPTICFCVDKSHAREMAEAFLLDGVAAEVIVDETDDDERPEMIARFEARTTAVLCSVGVLAVGFDSPIATCAILARPTLSTMLFVQQAGRVLRPYPGKTHAIILDHAANILRHGLPNDFVPPTDLSLIDEKADRKRRNVVRDENVVCSNCEALYPRREDACPECGTPRQRYSKVVVFDGELRPVEWDSDEAEPEGSTPTEIRAFYCEMLTVVEQRGWKVVSAFFQTCERFDLRPDFKDPVTSAVLPYEWRSLASPITPTSATLRSVVNRRKHYFARTRGARQAGADATV